MLGSNLLSISLCYSDCWLTSPGQKPRKVVVLHCVLLPEQCVSNIILPENKESLPHLHLLYVVFERVGSIQYRAFTVNITSSFIPSKIGPWLQLYS